MATDARVELLERAIDQARRVVAAIPAEQADLPTPCADWRVADLVRHLVQQDLRNFAVSARGETADWAAPAGELDADWSAAFSAGAAAVLDAWSTADLDAAVAMPGGGSAPLAGRIDHQIAELATHSWDLVQATGVEVPLDDELAERGLAWSRGMLRPQMRGAGKAFDAEVPVPAGAPAYDRLAGWFGRDPQWASR